MGNTTQGGTPKNVTLKDVILPVVSVLVAAVGAWQTHVATRLKADAEKQRTQFEQAAKELELALEQQREQRAGAEGQQAFLLKVFEYVENTISAERVNRRREEAALALVRTLPDSESKFSLIKILEKGSLDEGVRREASEEAFALLDQNPSINAAPVPRPPAAAVPAPVPPPQQAQAPAQSPAPATGATAASRAEPAWGKWDIDLFWCARSGGGARQLADTVAGTIRRQGAQGRIRVRELPGWKNEQFGYRYAGLVVGYNAGSEDAIAAKLQGVMSRVAANQPVALRPVSSPTAWYLSGFVCPATVDAGVAAVRPAEASSYRQ